MPENINKCYRKGDWGKDNDQQRYDHIVYWLQLYQNGTQKKDPYIDLMDLKWFIKCAFTRRVYLSKAVKAMRANAWLPTKEPFLQTLLNDILTKGYTDDQNALELRKWKGKGLVFEHIVPADVYIKDVINLYVSGKFTFQTFQQMRDKLHVCVITKGEDNLLNKNHLKTSMPPQSCWLYGDEWARYKAAGIQVSSILTT